MNSPKKPNETVGLDVSPSTQIETRSLGDLGIFGAEVFENDFRRVGDALALLNGNKEVSTNSTQEPLLQ